LPDSFIFLAKHSKNLATVMAVKSRKIYEQKTDSEFKTFKDPRHRFHGIDYLREIKYVVELILGYIDSKKISEQLSSYSMLCVLGKDTLLINTFPTRKHYVVVGRG
jgi:hypothetical protein